MNYKSDQELIDAYLASGKTITICPCIDEVVGPYEGKLQKSGTPMEFNRDGTRIYRNLGKTMEIYPQDETMRNYGKDS